jgi:6-phosphogluconolactonase
VRVHQCPGGSLAVEVSRRIVELLGAAIAARGRASLAVSGGRSPLPLFAALSQADLAWPQVAVTLVDERWVDGDSDDSNERMVRRHLLVGKAKDAAFLGLKTAAATPAAALANRQEALRALPLPFDVVLLGMGEDGHTASLFPGADGLAAALDPAGGDLLAAIDAPAAAHRRLGLSLRGILASRHIVLSIAGSCKRSVFERANGGGADPMTLPVAAVLRQVEVPVDVFIGT